MGQALCQVLGMVPAWWEPTKACIQTTKPLLYKVWSPELQQHGWALIREANPQDPSTNQLNQNLRAGRDAQESVFVSNLTR